MRLASFCRARAESDHSGSYPADPESSNFTFGLHVNLKQQLPTDASAGIKSSINRQFSPRDVRSLIRSKEKSSICNIFWPAPPANWYQLVSCLTFLCTHIRNNWCFDITRINRIYTNILTAIFNWVVCVKFCKLAVMVLVMRLCVVRFSSARAVRPY